MHSWAANVSGNQRTNGGLLVACTNQSSENTATCHRPTPTKENRMLVHMSTNHGVIVLELESVKAPKTVDNFLQYVREKHYDGTIFHRVIDKFMIQGGGFGP